MNAIELYRTLLRSAHDFLEGTLADVTPAQFTWDPPGKAFSIGANYAHVLGAEDMTIHGLLKGNDLLAASAWAGKVGASEAPPLGPGVDLKGWSQRAKLDLAGMRRYGQAVYAATDEYLGLIGAEELGRPIDLSRFGLGTQTVLFVLTAILSNAALHTGEISCLLGQLGTKGYPV
ncbi:MAG: DinB family protein [bacterium]